MREIYNLFVAEFFLKRSCERKISEVFRKMVVRKSRTTKAEHKKQEVLEKDADRSLDYPMQPAKSAEHSNNCQKSRCTHLKVCFFLQFCTSPVAFHDEDKHPGHFLP